MSIANVIKNALGMTVEPAAPAMVESQVRLTKDGPLVPMMVIPGKQRVRRAPTARSRRKLAEQAFRDNKPHRLALIEQTRKERDFAKRKALANS